mgnify:CR=1 FL=1
MILAFGRFKATITRFLLRPRITVSGRDDTIRLGSEYGGWALVDDPELYGSTILSFGLGEDASLDVEFAARYGATVMIFDPTPRAMAHFEHLSQQIGKRASQPYVSGGKQPVGAYNLSEVAPHQLKLFELAVSDRSGTSKFFAPANNSHVSYSLVNLQNSQDLSASHITVDVTSVADIQALIPLGTVSLVKMDIEGAEILVLHKMLETDFLPKQLLVEFDELNFPSGAARTRFYRTHRRIHNSGYHVSFWDKRSCISYRRNAVT